MCYPISMKKFYLFFTFVFLSVFSFAQDKLFALEGVQSSAYAKYIDGDEILDKNSSLRLSPASVAKLFTTAAALDTFGPDHTFETKIYFNGRRKGSKIKGDIYIVGSGDPSLASKYFEKSIEDIFSSWAKALKEQGITKITGNIYADNTLFKDDTLPVYTTYQNIGNYFAAPADALTVKDNNFSVYFEPSSSEGSLGKIAQIFPQEYNIPIEVKAYHTEEVSREDTYLNFVPLSEKMLITGRLPLTNKKIEVLGAMANPALFAAQYFKIKLQENGIKVKGKASIASQEKYLPENLLYTNISVPLKDIIQKTNKRSLNLYADILLRHLGKGNVKEGFLNVKTYLDRIGVDSQNINLYDGSGLARSNYTTCKTIVSLLEAVFKQPYGEDFIESLSVVGDENDIGNMATRMQNTLAAGKARVKTGFIDGVRAHAGYIEDKQNKLVAFCIISNNFTLSRSEIDSLHEEIILSLASLDKKTDKRVSKK